MRDNSSRRGAADLGTPLMIVAFLVIGGFLLWLYQQAQAEEAMQIQEAQERAAEQAEAERRENLVVSAESFQMDASNLSGDSLIVERQGVASRLGSQGFWMEMPNGNPFLVSFSDAVQAQGTEVTNGQTVTVTGVMLEMTDSVISAWTEAGTVSEGDALAAEFATHFIEAAQVEVVPGAPARDTASQDTTAAGGSGGA